MGEDGRLVGATKRCPHCAEEIQAAAVRCRYCQVDFAAVAANQTVEKVKMWFWVAVLAGMVWAFVSVGRSCNETNRKAELASAEALLKYRQAASALDKGKPVFLQDATKLIGDNPLICRDDEERGEPGAVCQWSFVGAGTIYVHADSKRNGARVRRVETREQ